MANLAQRSFAAGELAPSLYARTDLQRYAQGLRTLRNFLCMKHGGVTNRAGTRYAVTAKDSANVLRLVPFIQSDDVSVLLEFGHLTLRFIVAAAHSAIDVLADPPAAWADATAYVVGDLVTQTAVHYYCIAAHTSATATDQPGTGTSWETKWHALTGTIYELPTPYPASDLAALQYVQSGAVLYLVHRSHAIRKLTRTSELLWVLEAAEFGPTIAGPSGIAKAGGGVGVATYWAVTTIAEETFEESEPTLFNSTDAIPSAGAPTTLTWNPVVNAREYAVYRSKDGGASYGFVGFGSGIPVEVTDTAWTDSSENVTTANSGVTATGGGQCINPLAAISATNRAHDGFYSIRGRLTITSTAFTSGVITARGLAYYSRDGETRVLAGTVGEFTIPVGNGLNNFDEAISVPDNGYTTLQIEVVPEILATGVFTDATATLTFTASPNDAVAWDRQTPGFVDAGDAPDMASRPPTHRALFNAVDRYPGTVGYYQQRLILARSNAEKSKVWASQSALPLNFGTSTPLLDSDAVTFSLVARRQNDVRHLVDLEQLLIGTSESWWLITGNEAGTLVPGQTNPRQISHHGTVADLPPLLLGATVLFVQARGSTVRDLLRTEADGTRGKDLTVFSQHLFDGKTIVDWAYQETPHSVVWAVRSDGTLLSLTYLPEFDVWGWARHDTAGTIENVCVIPEGTEDALYLVVKRTINGAVVRYVERMANRYFADQVDAVFMDAAVDATTSGLGDYVYSGLDHLEGESVSVLADGNVLASPHSPQYADIIVSGGEITLDADYDTVRVGLPFVSDLTTLDIDTPSGPSLKPDRRININTVTLVVEATRGLWLSGAAPTSDALDPARFYEPKLREMEAWDAATETLTGDVTVKIGGRWNTNGRVTVRQVDPLPVTVLAAIPQGSIG